RCSALLYAPSLPDALPILTPGRDDGAAAGVGATRCGPMTPGRDDGAAAAVSAPRCGPVTPGRDDGAAAGVSAPRCGPVTRGRAAARLPGRPGAGRDDVCAAAVGATRCGPGCCRSAGEGADGKFPSLEMFFAPALVGGSGICIRLR